MKQFFNAHKIVAVTLTVMISVFLVSVVVYATTTIGTSIDTGGYASSTSALNTQGSLHVGVDAKVENKATTTVALIVGSNASAPKIDLSGGDIYAQGDVEVGGTVTTTAAVNTQGTLHIGGTARIEGITTTTAHIYLPLVKFQTGVATSTNPQKGECFMPDDRFKCYNGANWICMGNVNCP